MIRAVIAVVVLIVALVGLTWSAYWATDASRTTAKCLAGMVSPICLNEEIRPPIAD
jgi:hypothetical protein